MGAQRFKRPREVRFGAAGDVKGCLRYGKVYGTEPTGCRLCLVTPPGAEPADFRPRLEQALSGGDVASLIVSAAPSTLRRLAETVVPIAQERGVAAVIHGPPDVAVAVNADGVHVDGGIEALKAALAARPRQIVGAGGLGSRHQAMLAGELEPDYVFFGRLDGDTGEAIFPKAIDFAAWWSAMFVIPAIVMGGRTTASVRQAVDAGTEFVALGRAVWEHLVGPGAAVAEANRWLAPTMEPAR